MDEIERTLLVKPEVFVYKIPPRPSARGYRAADWNLSAPDWTGRLRILVKGKKCEIRLEDKGSGELFASCPVEVYPGASVESVTDSSRYFVICIQDSGRKAYIGMGFADRSDSFDLNVALQDHFKMLKKEDNFTKELTQPPAPNLDLAFKAGQTIRINIPNKSENNSKSDKQTKKNAGGGLTGLPPPPGGIKIGGPLPPPGAGNLTPLQSPSEPTPSSVIGQHQQQKSSNLDLLADFMGPNPTNSNMSNPVSTGAGDDPWGDFASAPSSSNASGSWEQF